MFKRFMERFVRGGQPFEDAFGFGPRGEMPMAGAGTGFIFHGNGHIATNYHVVDGADEITVTLHDGREFKAEVVGTDPDTDLAVLKIDAKGRCPTSSSADSDKVRVGDPVIAIGNPFGLGGTVPPASSRPSTRDRRRPLRRLPADRRADQPRQLGRPDLQPRGPGRRRQHRDPQPDRRQRRHRLRDPSNPGQADHRRLRGRRQGRARLARRAHPGLDEDLAKSLGLDETKGALVAEVTPDSPAASAGFKQGDVILSYGGKQIDQLRDLTSAVADTEAGANVDVVVWRDGARRPRGRDRSDAQRGADGGAVRRAQPKESDTPKLGLMLGQLTPRRGSSSSCRPTSRAWW